MTPTIYAEPAPLRLDESGTLRVGDTRITLDLLVARHRLGDSPAEIVRAYDILTLADVHAAIAYYLRHQSELDEYLRQREEAADRLQKEIEANQRPGPTKEELLRRLAERNQHASPGK